MKLSIETYVLIKRFGEEKAFQLIKDSGFDCVDYSFYWLSDNLKKDIFGGLYLEHAEATRKLLDKIGLICNQAHAPFDFNSSTDKMDLSNENYVNIIKSMEIASILGAENIVIHALHPTDDKNVFDVNYGFYKSLETYAEKFKIHIAIENLFGLPYDNEKKKYTKNRFDRPKAMKELLNKLNSEWFVCCLDVGHATITGIEPQDFIKEMDNRLKVLHIHDNDYEFDRHMLPYIGKINWNEVAKGLKETGYDGEFTFEIFKFLEGFDDELLPYALKLAENTGRHIINKINM